MDRSVKGLTSSHEYDTCWTTAQNLCFVLHFYLVINKWYVYFAYKLSSELGLLCLNKLAFYSINEITL